jgi:hypothetical protein
VVDSGRDSPAGSAAGEMGSQNRPGRHPNGSPHITLPVPLICRAPIGFTPTFLARLITLDLLVNDCSLACVP